MRVECSSLLFSGDGSRGMEEPSCLALSLEISSRRRRGRNEARLCLCVSSSASESISVIPVSQVQVVFDGPWHQGKPVLLLLGTSGVLKGKGMNLLL